MKWSSSFFVGKRVDAIELVKNQNFVCPGGAAAQHRTSKIATNYVATKHEKSMGGIQFSVKTVWSNAASGFST
jgi:hypothetical protein